MYKNGSLVKVPYRASGLSVGVGYASSVGFSLFIDPRSLGPGGISSFFMGF